MVDFISDTLTSRAVISKGSLNLIYEPTDVGHSFYIINENHETCTGEGTKLHVNNQVISADDRGKMVLPYSRKAIYTTAVMEVNGFASTVLIDL